MNLVYTEEAERLIAHENAQWTAYAEYPLLFEQELDEAIVEIHEAAVPPRLRHLAERKDSAHPHAQGPSFQK